jgi:hypothetical protein
VHRTKSYDLPLRQKRDGSWTIPPGDMVWTCFSSDFLLEDADEWRPWAWAMMKVRSDLDFFFITKRIHRLMNELGISSARKRAYKATTNSPLVTPLPGENASSPVFPIKSLLLTNAISASAQEFFTSL